MGESRLVGNKWLVTMALQPCGSSELRSSSSPEAFSVQSASFIHLGADRGLFAGIPELDWGLNLQIIDEK